MLFEVRVESEADVPVLCLLGDLTGDGGSDLEAASAGLREIGTKRLLLDLSALRYINSSGIAALLGLITTAVKLEQRVDFCSVPDHLRKVMDLVGMTDYVRSFPTRTDALEAAK